MNTLLETAKELIRAMNENRCHSEAFDDLAGAIKEAEAAPHERKIVQIAEGGMPAQEGVHPAFAWTTALCNDGTVWVYNQGHGWGKEPLPPIPQGEST